MGCGELDCPTCVIVASFVDHVYETNIYHLLQCGNGFMKPTFITCYNVGMDFGIFFGLRMAIKTHSLEKLSIMGRSTAAYFVNPFFLMLWEIQVQ